MSRVALEAFRRAAGPKTVRGRGQAPAVPGQQVWEMTAAGARPRLGLQRDDESPQFVVESLALHMIVRRQTSLAPLTLAWVGRS